MHVLVVNLTAAMLLIHATLGCCKQSVVCTHGDRATSGAIASVTHDDACCRQSHEERDADRHAPCDCKIECRGVCHFIQPDEVQVGQDCDSLLSDVALFYVAALPANLLAPQIASSPSRHLAAGDPQAPPLRLHLLHQILLV